MRLSYVIGFICLFAGCAAYTPPSFTTPEVREEQIVYRYTYAMTSPVEQTSLEFRDEALLCRLIPQELVIGLDVINLGVDPVSIDWNQVRLIDPEGVPHSILHKMVILPDVNRRLLPTHIEPQGVLNEAVAPIDYVFMDFTGWKQRPLFPNTEDAIDLKGATFGITLPVKRKNAVKTYMFEFQVTDVSSVVLVK